MDTGTSNLDPASLGIALLVLIVISAFFSGSETALLGFDWLRLRYLVRKGDKRAAVLRELLIRKDMLIGTILVGNNIANVAASAIATALALSLFGESGILVATATMTVFLLIFAEISPKTFASQHTEKVGLGVARIFSFLSKALYPFVVLVTTLSNLFLKIFGVDISKKVKRYLSEEEIRHLVAEGSDAALLAENKRKMLHGIFQMSRHTVREVMVPRTRVVALDIATPVEEAAQILVKTGKTRLPVYRENMDSIAGIAHARDILALLAKKNSPGLFSVVHETLFVPETMNLEDLLYQFQRKRTHIAVVVDEFGGVEGIVTLEDVLEEIVGEILDEHDIEGDAIRFLPGGEALVRGSASIRDVNNALKLKIPSDVDVTIGGFVMTTIGHIPEGSESFVFENVRFSVERTSGRRIILVRVTPIPPAPTSEQ